MEDAAAEHTQHNTKKRRRQSLSRSNSRNHRKRTSIKRIEKHNRKKQALLMGARCPSIVFHADEQSHLPITNRRLVDMHTEVLRDVFCMHSNDEVVGMMYRALLIARDVDIDMKTLRAVAVRRLGEDEVSKMEGH